MHTRNVQTAAVLVALSFACVGQSACACSFSPTPSASPEISVQASTDTAIEISGPLIPPIFTRHTADAGEVDAAAFGPSCSGWTRDVPHHRLRVTQRMPFLRVMALSRRSGRSSTEADLTLVVRGPGDTVWCIDDGAAGFTDPWIDHAVEVGEYDIYVGNHDRGVSTRYQLSLIHI